jgi:hypothetical protein
MSNRVTAAELLELADAVSAAANRASNQAVTTSLASALTHVIEAARSAAFREVLDEHTKKQAVPRQFTGEGEK